jgi:hypothetical protein
MGKKAHQVYTQMSQTNDTSIVRIEGHSWNSHIRAVRGEILDV